MSNIESNVSSVDTKAYVKGLAKLVNKHMKKGFTAYIITFMFDLKGVKISEVMDVTRGEIDRVYARFLTEAVRDPWSRKNKRRRPILIASPDWPVFKGRMKRRRSLPSQGAHAAGILLVPESSRLKVGVKGHFAAKERAYIRSDSSMSRIHIEPIESRVAYVVDYTFKALKRGRCSIDDLIINPKARSEQTRPDRDTESSHVPMTAAWDSWGRGTLRHLACR